jgi:hypothetical protein
MSINLGIELGDDRFCAAYERGGTMRMVVVGGGRTSPLQAHVGRSGAIRVGSDAVAAASDDPAGMVRDLPTLLDDQRSVVINGFAVTGELLVAHVLTAIVDAAEAQAQGGPVAQIVIACPPSWPAARRAAVRAAAGQAGLNEVELVSSARAVERAPEGARQLPEQATALGAAVLALRRANGVGGAPGAAPRPRPGRPAAPIATAAPTSVFDATDPATGGSAARPGGRPPGPGPVGGGSGGGGSGGGGSGGGGPFGPAGGDEADDRPNRLPFLLAGGVLAVLLVVLAVVAITRGGGEPSAADDPSTSTTSAPVATTTTVTTSTTVTTTSRPPATTTTTTSTSTTTTTRPGPTTSTSTTLVPPSRIGPVALASDGLVLQFGSATSFTLRFGDDADGTISRVTALIGRPTSDTGWKEVALCTGDETRRVVYGDLELVFTKDAANAPSGSRTFQQWFVSAPGKKPDGLVTLDKIGIGSTIADLRKYYGDALKVVQPIPGDPAGLFTSSENGEFIDGITTGTTDKSWITQMWAGSACQRVAD